MYTMLTQIGQIEHHSAGVGHSAYKRTTVDRFAIELDVNVM